MSNFSMYNEPAASKASCCANMKTFQKTYWRAKKMVMFYRTRTRMYQQHRVHMLDSRNLNKRIKSSYTHRDDPKWELIVVVIHQNPRRYYPHRHTKEHIRNFCIYTSKKKFTDNKKFFENVFNCMKYEFTI